MELSVKKEVTVQAKTIKLHIKVRDSFCASITDQDNEEIFNQEDGYVWDFMPEDHYGDYLILNIDIDTGQITNWQKPTQQELENLINGEENE